MYVYTVCSHVIYQVAVYNVHYKEIFNDETTRLDNEKRSRKKTRDDKMPLKGK